MDNNIHINPESIGKFMAISDEPSPEGYESPITGYISQLSQQIIEQSDNAIVAQINEQINMDVDKNELIRALNYDRNQFNEGYRKGYHDAQKKYIDNKIIFNVICGKFMWLPAIQTEDIRGKEYNMTDVENVITAMANISASLPDYEILFKFNKAE